MSETITENDYSGHEFAKRAHRVMTRGNTRSTVFVPPNPPYAVKGTGCTLIDQFDHEVIDCNNNYTALIHGHSDPAITQAVSPHLTSGTAFGLPTESEIGLAELLSSRTGYDRWRFSNSGTEAVMTAIRTARAFNGRDVVIRFAGSYHGTSDPVVPDDAPGVPDSVRRDVIVVPQGDRAAYDRALAVAGERLSAVLVDLMPNRAGLVPLDAEFVQHLRNSTTRVGALLIVDEVITLRLHPGGLAKQYDIVPDLVTAGKIIGGGFPVGAVGGRDDVLAVFDPLHGGRVAWGGTFSANPMSMTAGRVAMEKFDSIAISSLNEYGNRLRRDLVADGIDVSGQGSLMRIRSSVNASKLWWNAYQRGVLLGTNGLLALSTAMQEQHIVRIRRAMSEAVTAAQDETC